jgi:beta-glucoside operon transcriptional antiterminator
VGIKALQRIKEKLNISLPEDEAGFIALHIVNAELNDEMTNIVNITKVMQEILNIVKYHFKIDFDEESLNYYRFITHLKFFAQRLFNKTYMDNEDDFLYDVIKEKYREAYRCTEKIREFISKKYNYDINAEEMVYLTIHIARVVTRN